MTEKKKKKGKAYYNKTELIDTSDSILYGGGRRWSRCCCNEHRIVFFVIFQHFSKILLKNVYSSRQCWWTEPVCNQWEMCQRTLYVWIEWSWNTVIVMTHHRWRIRWRCWTSSVSTRCRSIVRCSSCWCRSVDRRTVLFENFTEFSG